MKALSEDNFQSTDILITKDFRTLELKNSSEKFSFM